VKGFVAVLASVLLAIAVGIGIEAASIGRGIVGVPAQALGQFVG